MSAEKENVIELVKTVKTSREAIRVSIRLWGGTEKQIWLELEMDKGHWHRCLSGSAHFPLDLIPKFCEIVGNDFLLHWQAYQRGYELRIMPKTLEEEVKKVTLEKEKALERVAYLESLLTRKEQE